MKHIDIYTIGFTKKKAEYFFEKLKSAGVKRVVDVRLNNVSQLAGFAKKDDLIYFLKELGGIDYVHFPELAPTKGILDAYKKQKGDWATYEMKFIELMERRHIENKIPKEVLNEGCLLCSEDKPHHCHRRLVAEYLSKKWDEEVEITHLV
ncbi:MAG TPA: DUF488 domain-containing protein [Gammaproteobacteria bacterium]|nr:DUF488 domain-containing protein [Gammaproteobacteria bacterium]